MTRHADRKKPARALAESFAIPYTVALAALEAHTPPTEAEVAAAELLSQGWEPRPSWPSARPGVFGLPIPVADRLNSGPADPDGVLGLDARPVTFEEEGAVALCVEVASIWEGTEHGSRGRWLNALSALLRRGGFRYHLDTYLPTWRAELTVVEDAPAAEVHVRLHQPGTGLVVFDAALSLPPAWLVAARLHSLGLQVVLGPLAVGPLAPTALPRELGEMELQELFEMRGLVGARIPLHITPAETRSAALVARRPRWGHLEGRLLQPWEDIEDWARLPLTEYPGQRLRRTMYGIMVGNVPAGDFTAHCAGADERLDRLRGQDPHDIGTTMAGLSFGAVAAGGDAERRARAEYYLCNAIQDYCHRHGIGYWQHPAFDPAWMGLYPGKATGAAPVDSFSAKVLARGAEAAARAGDRDQG